MKSRTLAEAKQFQQDRSFRFSLTGKSFRGTLVQGATRRTFFAFKKCQPTRDHAGEYAMRPLRKLMPMALISVAGSACTSVEEPVPGVAWELMPSLPLAVRAPAAVARGSRIYVVGGTAVSGRTPAVQILDLVSGTWSYGAALPIATDWGAAAWAGDRLHFVGGVTDRDAASRQHWIYSPSTNEWTIGAPLPTAAAGAAIASAESRIFVFGGIDGPSAHSDNTLIYNVVTGQWSTGRPVPGPRINWAGAAVAGQVLAVGGGTPGLGTSGDLLSYDPGRDAWTARPPIPLPREAHGAAVVGRLFCVAGGRYAAPGNFNIPFDDTSCYDVVSRSWTPLPFLPEPRQELALVSVGAFIFALGGRDQHGDPVTAVTRLRMR